MKTIVLAMLVAASGCVSYSPSQLVLVDVSPKIGNRVMYDFDSNRSLPLSVYWTTATHYWDQVGCRFRTREEMGDLDPDAVIHVVEANKYENVNDYDAWYSPVDGKIRVNVERFEEGRWEQLVVGASLFAHELGHSLGLGHVHDGVMSVGGVAQSLSAEDLKEFYSAYPR